MTILLDSLDVELRRLPQNNPGHVRMPYPLRDIGYTNNGPSRLRTQENLKQGSNPLMSLFNAIAHSNPTFKARKRAALVGTQAVTYRLHGDVVSLGFGRDHAAIGQIVFSVLAQSYIETGKGFSGVLAGGSIRYNAGYDDDDDDFSKWQGDVWNTSPMQGNHQAERRRAAELQEKMAKIEQLKLRRTCHSAQVLAEFSGAQVDIIEAASFA